MEVRELTSNELEKWNELVQRSPQGTVFHSASWMGSISRYIETTEWKTRIAILGAFSNGDLIGGCPISFESHESRIEAYSPPRSIGTYYGGIVLLPPPSENVRKKEDLCRKVIEALDDKLMEMDVNYARIKNSPYVRDVRPFSWRGWKAEVMYTYIYKKGTLPLDKKARWAIKDALKHEVEVRPQIDFNIVHELYEKTCERKNIPSLPLKYFEIMLQQEAGCFEQFTAYKDGKPLSVIVTMNGLRRSCCWMMGSEEKSYNSPSLLLFHALNSLNKGDEMDLLGANDYNVAYFKAAFNPELVPFYVVSRKS